MSATGLDIFSHPWVEIEHRPRLWNRLLFGWRPAVVRLHPVRIRDLGEMCRLVPAATREGPEQDRAALGCLALCADMPADRLAMLPKAVLATAMSAMVGLNPELFRAPEPEPEDPDARPRPWADQIATLLGAGHALPDIDGYTIAQFQSHLAAADRAADRAHARAIMAARLAWADWANLAPILESLNGGAL